MNPTAFIFESYEWEPGSREIRLRYRLDEELVFEERLQLPEGDLMELPAELLDRALFNLHLIGGISYFKTYCPREIRVLSGHLNEAEACFWNKLYTQGLGEFFYENKVDFRGLVKFPVTPGFEAGAHEMELPKRSLLPLGGGKDSIVAAELLRKAGFDFDVFNLSGHAVSREVAEVMGKDLIVVKRTLSEKLFELNAAGAMNGHIPITAYVSFLSVLMALLYGYDTVVFANEASANYGNVTLHGVEVNHQYSKSLEFEQDLTGYLMQFLTPSVRVFSLLRPWYELRIAKEYAELTEYHHVATSCNRNFKIHGEAPARWCGECPKCAFVFTMLAPFMDKEPLVEMFGKNLLADESLLPLFEELVGERAFKPFECVGTPDEMRTALKWLRERGDYEGDIVVDRLTSPPEREDFLVFHRAHLLPAGFLSVFRPRFLILGFGVEGRSLYDYLNRSFPRAEIGVADRNPMDLPKDVVAHLGEDYLDALAHYDLILKSPGVPWQDEFNAHKDRFSSSTQLFFDQLDSSNTVIAVTGSKGKSTTASLMAAVIKASGKPVVLVGNIGEPMLSHAEVKDHLVVVELSSYQLEHVWMKPKIAIITSLFPDHLDYHGGFENYASAKSKITENQGPEDFLIYHKKYTGIDQMVTGAMRLGINKYEPVASRLEGPANQDNIALVRTAAHLLDLDKATIDAAIADFEPLPHRLETVRIHKGVTYVDDANATTPEGTLAALAAFKGRVGTIFLGGQDRGYDFRELGKELAAQQIPNVILFPQSGAAIQKAWPSDYQPTVFKTDQMTEAVAWAAAHTTTGSIALLSMASPSYGLFKNFKDKGDQFQKAVHELE